jgi:hypothetical protein
MIRLTVASKQSQPASAPLPLGERVGTEQFSDRSTARLIDRMTVEYARAWRYAIVRVEDSPAPRGRSRSLTVDDRDAASWFQDQAALLRTEVREMLDEALDGELGVSAVTESRDTAPTSTH